MRCVGHHFAPDELETSSHQPERHSACVCVYAVAKPTLHLYPCTCEVAFSDEGRTEADPEKSFSVKQLSLARQRHEH